MHNEPTPVTFRSLIQSLLNEVPVTYAPGSSTVDLSASQKPESIVEGYFEPEIRTEVNHEIINDYLRTARKYG